jgi:hypothetical protein
MRWIRRLFSSSRPDEEAAEREEYGLPDPAESDHTRARSGSSFADMETRQAMDDELDALKAPPDRAP